jgi:hypothetical protein
MKVGQLSLDNIGRDINPVIKVADYTEAELQSELEDYMASGSGIIFGSWTGIIMASV